MFASMSGISHRRVYDSWFTTEEQLRLLALEDYDEHYMAQLRMDLLVFETLVVPDTAILDGWFLGQHSPQELAIYCGRGILNPTLPIEVRTRSATLEQSIALFLQRDDRETLNDYPLQLLRDTETRLALSKALRITPKSKLHGYLTCDTPTRAVARLLQDLLRGEGFDPSIIDGFLPVWESWIEGERSGLVRVVPWDRHIDVPASAASDPLSSRDIQTPAGMRAYRRICDLIQNGTYTKSDALRIITDEDLVSMEDSRYRDDGNAIVSWFDIVRSRALASQHSATFAYDQPALHANAKASGFRGLAARVDDLDLDELFVVTLPDDFRAMLQTMTPETYRSIFTIQRKLLRSLWREPTPRTLSRVVGTTYDYGSPGGMIQRPSAVAQGLRVFGLLGSAVAGQQIAGPVAAVGMVLASEAAMNSTNKVRKTLAVRGVCEYLKARPKLKRQTD